MDVMMILSMLLLAGNWMLWLGVAVVLSTLVTIYQAKGEKLFSMQTGKYFLKMLAITIPVSVVVFLIYAFNQPM